MRTSTNTGTLLLQDFEEKRDSKQHTTYANNHDNYNSRRETMNTYATQICPAPRVFAHGYNNSRLITHDPARYLRRGI